MKTVGIKCPFCGGNLEFENGSKPVKCPFCDSQVFLEETENSSVRAGYDFEKGRMKARRDAAKERLEEEKEKVRAKGSGSCPHPGGAGRRKQKETPCILDYRVDTLFSRSADGYPRPFKNAQNIEDFDCRRSVGYLYCNDCERHGVGREKTGRKRF